MRALGAIALLLATFALIGCAPAPAPSGIVGRYTDSLVARDDPGWRGLVGDWVHEYRADGHVIIRQIGGMNMNMEALYRLDGDILILTDLGGVGSCRHFGVDYGSARYRIHFTDTGMRVEPLLDECTPRRFGMSVHTWQRIR
jgi:hypothetical protein